MARSKSEQEAKSKQVKRNMATGTDGEKIVKANLQGRQLWKSNIIVDSIIDPEKIVCKAQVWEGSQSERKNNLDYYVQAGPCKTCRISGCEYKNRNPYPKAIRERHEIKTNPATHVGKAYWAVADSGKKFAPTGNLFIEVWQDVTIEQAKAIRAKQEEPVADIEKIDEIPQVCDTDRHGWYQIKPPAHWYHFYQPVKANGIDITEKEVLTDESKLPRIEGETDQAYDDRVNQAIAEAEQRFEKEMTTSNRLIKHRPWAYVISIRGDHIERCVKEICIRENNGKLTLKETRDKSTGTTSFGYLLPITELLNNPAYYNREGVGAVAFTHLPEVVKGTKPSDIIKPTYYLNEIAYDTVFKKNPKRKREIKPLVNQIEALNHLFLIIPNFTIELSIPELADIPIRNAWARPGDDNNSIKLTFQPMQSDETREKKLPIGILDAIISDPKFEQFADAHVWTTFAPPEQDSGGKGKNKAVIKKSLATVPIIMLLSNSRRWAIWPDNT